LRYQAIRIIGSNERLFTIDLNQIIPTLPLGATQKVVAKGISLPISPPADAFIDITIARFTNYQAESALLGGGVDHDKFSSYSVSSLSFSKLFIL
jgi:hypothetical protein